MSRVLSIIALIFSLETQQMKILIVIFYFNNMIGGIGELLRKREAKQ